METQSIPVSAIVKKNFWILFSFLIQITLPILIYLTLYLSGSLAMVSHDFVLAHLMMLFLIYLLFALHIFSGIDRSKVEVMSPNPSNEDV